MNRQQIVERLDQPLDFDLVKREFENLWTIIFDFSIGEVSYLKLADEESLDISNERLLAYILIGVSRVFSRNIGPCPDGAEGYWAAVCNLVGDMPIREEERINYRIRITQEDETS